MRGETVEVRLTVSLTPTLTLTRTSPSHTVEMRLTVSLTPTLTRTSPSLLRNKAAATAKDISHRSVETPVTITLPNDSGERLSTPR